MVCYSAPDPGNSVCRCKTLDAHCISCVLNQCARAEIGQFSLQRGLVGIIIFARLDVVENHPVISGGVERRKLSAVISTSGARHYAPLVCQECWLRNHATAIGALERGHVRMKNWLRALHCFVLLRAVLILRTQMNWDIRGHGKLTR